MSPRTIPTSVKVVLAIYVLNCAVSAWQFFTGGQTRDAVSFTLNTAVLAGLHARYAAAFHWARWVSALQAVLLLAFGILAFESMLREPAIAAWMVAAIAMCSSVFLLLGRRDAKEYFMRPVAAQEAEGVPTTQPHSAWWLYSIALAIVVLVAVQLAYFALLSGDQAPPRLIKAIAELPVTLLLVFLYVFGPIINFLLGLPTTPHTEPSRGVFYLIAGLFFATFNAALFLPLLLYVRTRSSVLLYVFAVLFGLYASFVAASFSVP